MIKYLKITDISAVADAVSICQYRRYINDIFDILTHL